MNDDTLMERALGAYFRNPDPAHYGATKPQPSGSASGVETINGLTYIVLRNTNGVLAVYRLTNQGTLRRMRRWPKAFNATATTG